jgi:hypothetical protein
MINNKLKTSNNKNQYKYKIDKNKIEFKYKMKE